MAARFGTPAQVLDTADIRARCRSYRSALPDAEIAYAGKAFLCRAIARLVEEEGLSLDVCSAGEIAVARAAGFSAQRLVLHGNVKTAEDLKAALAAGVGRIVVDSVEEIEALATWRSSRNGCSSGSRPESTGTPTARSPPASRGSKFGFSLATGAALDAVAQVLARPALRLAGLRGWPDYTATSARRSLGWPASSSRRTG